MSRDPEAQQEIAVDPDRGPVVSDKKTDALLSVCAPRGGYPSATSQSRVQKVSFHNRKVGRHTASDTVTRATN